VGTNRTRSVRLAMSVHRGIVLQNSQNGCSDFFAKRATKRQSPIDVSLSALPKLPVSSSLVALVPHMIIRSPRPQPGKFIFSDPKRVLQHNPGQSRSSVEAPPLPSLTLMYGPAVRCKRFVDLVVSGLASMYPVSSWSRFAPDHHGYQRACDLINGQASIRPFGSPVFACAGKTEPPSLLILSQTSAGNC
jgi:hypothetical protein